MPSRDESTVTPSDRRGETIRVMLEIEAESNAGISPLRKPHPTQAHWLQESFRGRHPSLGFPWRGLEQKGTGTKHSTLQHENNRGRHVSMIFDENRMNGMDMLD